MENFKNAKEDYLVNLDYQKGLMYRERRYCPSLHADPRVFDDVDTMIAAIKIDMQAFYSATQKVREDKTFRLNYLALQSMPLARLPFGYTSPIYEQFNQTLQTLWEQSTPKDYPQLAKEALEKVLKLG